MLGKDIHEHIKIINDTIKDHDLSYEQRQNFVSTLSEDDMRMVFMELCKVWCSSKENHTQ